MPTVNKHAQPIVMENAKIILRNFRGLEKGKNPEGKRNFCLLIEDDDFADTLMADGWNVKVLKSRDPEEPDKHMLPVEVRFNEYGPHIFMLSSEKMTRLNETRVGLLDSAEIENVDLRVRPRYWENMGKEGIKAFLENMVVTIREDPIMAKYSRYMTDEEPESSADDDEYLPFN